MTKEYITMSQKEVDRVTIISQVVAKQLRQKDAARMLNISERQVKRLVRRYREEGPEGLILKWTHLAVQIPTLIWCAHLVT